LGPPIAIGAFVVGTGIGTLLGEARGIDYILGLWYGKEKHVLGHGWVKTGPKPLLNHRLRWILRSIFHRGWATGHPPFFKYGPSHYLKHYAPLHYLKHYGHHPHHHPRPPHYIHPGKHVY